MLNYLFSLNSFLSFYLKSIPNLTQKIPLLALFLIIPIQSFLVV
ncbi:hypothetical protein HPHPH18_0778 [Helicobacter pylori Hp H-18]|nr:hypothetical protein HPHPH3_0611 [Helicobacter pylori Hp H-3]EJB90537.1 hypothetical protein HPHPH18_0778 [Helicobacter pylori Hp H-18]